MSRIKEGMLCIVSVKCQLTELRGIFCTAEKYVGLYEKGLQFVPNAWRCTSPGQYATMMLREDMLIPVGNPGFDLSTEKENDNELVC